MDGGRGRRSSVAGVAGLGRRASGGDGGGDASVSGPLAATTFLCCFTGYPRRRDGWTVMACVWRRWRWRVWAAAQRIENTGLCELPIVVWSAPVMREKRVWGVDVCGCGRAQQRGPWVRQRHLPPCRDASIGRARERASTQPGSCGIGGGVGCVGRQCEVCVVGMRAADDVKIEAFV